MARTATLSVSLLLTLAIGCLLLPGSAFAQYGVTVYGFVNDRHGMPVSNVSVTLLEDNVPLYTSRNPAMTDAHGYYEFFGIRRGIYCLMAEKKAFSSSATVLLETQDKAVNITLQGSATDLSDVSPAPASPSPSPGPIITSATPVVPETTPAATAAPGVEAMLALSGLFATGLLMQRMRRA
jgi:hypothetical protein